MADEEYVRHLESRLATLRYNVDALAKESQEWREKYDGVADRIEALEMIVAQANVHSRPNVGRTLYVSVTLNEELILGCKDSETMAELTIDDAWKRLAHELKGALIAG
jgi:prefoldin subunit 5